MQRQQLARTAERACIERASASTWPSPLLLPGWGSRYSSWGWLSLSEAELVLAGGRS